MPGLRRPALYRASRYFSIAATLAAIVILLFVGASVYSATQFRPSQSKGNDISTGVTSQGFQFTSVINFSNPSFLPIDRVHLASVVNLPGNASLLATGASPNVSIPAATVGHVPLTILVPFSGRPGADLLLTHNGELPTAVWANVSFGKVFVVSVRVNTTIHWGAPFDAFNVTIGPPQTTNGSRAVPVTLSFSDNAPFGVDGTLLLELGSAASGCPVTPVTFPLAVASQSSESSTQLVPVGSGCSYPPGSTVSAAFTSAAWSVTLPPETIP